MRPLDELLDELPPEARAEIENFRDRLAKRGAAVQVARDAVVSRARDWKISRNMIHGIKGTSDALAAAVAELDRQEAKLKEGCLLGRTTGTREEGT